MTDPNLAAQGESKRVVLDNKRCYQLYLRPTKVEATMQPWLCNSIWWHIASHSPVRFFSYNLLSLSWLNISFPSQLDSVCIACKSLVPRKENEPFRRMTGRIRHLWHANDVKKKIELLDDRVRRAHQSFTVWSLIWSICMIIQLTSLDDGCSKHSNLSQDEQLWAE